VKFVLAMLLAFGLLLVSCKTNRPVPPEGSEHIRMWTPNPLPLLHDDGVAYYKVKDDLFDRKHMTRISIALIVQSGITKPNIEALLGKYFRDAAARKGFYWRPRADHIDVSAFVSPEHMASDMGQWLAMEFKTPADSVPQWQFDDVQFAQIGVAPVDRFGLTDAQRRVVFRKLIEDAHSQPPLMPIPEADSLLQAHHLSRADLDSVSAEGLAKHWAFPTMQVNG